MALLIFWVIKIYKFICIRYKLIRDILLELVVYIEPLIDMLFILEFLQLFGYVLIYFLLLSTNDLFLF